METYKYFTLSWLIIVRVGHIIMNKEEKIQIISWCKSCITVTTDSIKTCAICKGQLNEMGWVEKNG
jgi:hypothetical protein